MILWNQTKGIKKKQKFGWSMTRRGGVLDGDKTPAHYSIGHRARLCPNIPLPLTPPPTNNTPLALSSPTSIIPTLQRSSAPWINSVPSLKAIYPHIHQIESTWQTQCEAVKAFICSTLYLSLSPSLSPSNCTYV